MNSVVFTDPVVRLLGDWAGSISFGSVALRLFLTMLLGAVIGYERSAKRHSAGLRTFMLAFLAGTVAALLDSWLFSAAGNGISFPVSAATVIGAAIITVHSVIYSSRNQIRGLTTAVALWFAVLVGMAIGLGCYTVGLAAFVAMLCTLFLFPALERSLKNRSNHFEVHLELTNNLCLQDFVTVIRRLGLTIDEIEQNPAYLGSGLSVYSISISVSNEMLRKFKSHTEIIDALKTLEYVYHIEEMRS